MSTRCRSGSLALTPRATWLPTLESSGDAGTQSSRQPAPLLSGGEPIICPRRHCPGSSPTWRQGSSPSDTPGAGTRPRAPCTQWNGSQDRRPALSDSAARLQRRHEKDLGPWACPPSTVWKARGCSMPCTLPDHYRGEGLQRLTNAGFPSRDQRVVLS